MKKKFIISVLVIFVLIVGVLSNTLFAAAMTKDALEANIKAYAEGTKTASATVDGATVTIDRDEGTTVVVDDSKITFTSGEVSMEVNYQLSDTETTFSVTQAYKSDMTDENYLLETMKPSAVLPMCFLAVTDAQQISSNDALSYYLKAVTAGTTTGTASDSTNKIANAKLTKISVTDEIFTYSQTEDVSTDTEYKVTNTLKINMNSDFSKIGSSGEIITQPEANEIVVSNEITPSNEIPTENIAEPIGNEIFDENQASNEIIPDAGPEDWISMAIVLVAVVIIFIMVMNLITTKKIRKQQ